MGVVNGAKQAVLVVEDDRSAAEILRMRLEAQNFEVHCARNGHEALKVVECKSLVLVVLDIMMPGMNGTDVCDVLRHDARTHAIPIIVVTAFDDFRTRKECERLGANLFLTKPLNGKLFDHKVRELLDLGKEAA